MKNIEEQIWEYVAGTCPPDEKKVLETLIEKDPAYRVLFEKINALHLQLKQLEMDEPSMGFERNIMNQIQMEPLPGKISSLIDKRIIYGIAAFFLISIFSLLGFAFYQLDWSNAASFTFQMPDLHLERYFNRYLIMAFMFIDMILGLYFLDDLLRKKLNS